MAGSTGENIPCGTTSKMREIVELADYLKRLGFPKTAESLYVVGWTMAVELYDLCSPKAVKVDPVKATMAPDQPKAKRVYKKRTPKGGVA